MTQVYYMNKTILDSVVVRIALIAVAIFLMIYLGAKTRNELQEYHYIGRNTRDTITIDGQGKVESKPNIAMVQLGVVSEGKDVKDTQEKNTQKMNSILEAVKFMGIASNDIQTSQYNVNPKYDWNDGKQTLIGYMVSQQISVKVREMDKSGTIISKAGELGANQIGGVTFTIDDPKLQQQEARRKAISDAQSKAEDVAYHLGMKIVRVVSFSEYSGGGVTPRPMYAMDKAVANESAMAAPSIEPGSEDVYSNVSVTFEVR